MKFPGRAILDLRIGHKEYHPIHSEPFSVLLTWPPYLSVSWHWPFTNRQFWFYIGFEPEGRDHFDITWWALRPYTTTHKDFGSDEGQPD